MLFSALYATPGADADGSVAPAPEGEGGGALRGEHAERNQAAGELESGSEVRIPVVKWGIAW